MIQAAVIGTGNISGSHIEGLLTFPERCRIAALVDIYPEKAEAYNKTAGAFPAKLISGLWGVGQLDTFGR